MLAVKRVVPIIALVTLGVLLSSTAYTAVQKGYVKDQWGHPIAGAYVVNTRHSGQVAQSDAITDVNGYYEVYAQDWSGSNAFVAYHPDYNMPYRWNDFWSSPEEGAMSMDWTLKKLYTGHTVYDTFSEMPNGELVLSNSGLIIGSDVGYVPFMPGDFDLTCRMRFSGSGPAAITYRQQPDSNYFGGSTTFYTYSNLGQYRTAVIDKGYGPLADPPLHTFSGPSFDSNGYYNVRLRAQGYHKQLWINGVEVTSHYSVDTIYDTSLPEPTVKGGYIGLFAGSGTTMYIDSISVTELTIVPEPSSIVTLLAGSAGILCFARRRSI